MTKTFIIFLVLRTFILLGSFWTLINYIFFAETVYSCQPLTAWKVVKLYVMSIKTNLHACHCDVIVTISTQLSFVFQSRDVINKNNLKLAVFTLLFFCV